MKKGCEPGEADGFAEQAVKESQTGNGAGKAYGLVFQSGYQGPGIRETVLPEPGKADPDR